jgi:hypothetical protein
VAAIPSTNAQAAPTSFLVAHRGGNRLDVLRSLSTGVRLIEADVRLFRGIAEVRHLKTLGPIPVLWDRWRIEPRRRRRLRLGDLLEVPTALELMLDLKGPRARLAHLVREALEPYLGTRAFTVCARWPMLLEPFADLPVRRVQSIGSRRQLDRLLRRGAASGLDAVAIHERLLDGQAVTRLRSVVPLLLTWPVNDLERARELVALGIDGLITDRIEAIAAVAS